MNPMEQFNVHWKCGEIKGKNTITAFDKEDAKLAFLLYTRHDGNIYNIPFEAEVVKVIGPLGIHKSSPKQKLAQKYGFIIGSIKGSKKQLMQAKTDMILASGPNAVKIERAYNLVEMQVAKTLRDISDLFKLAGLKVK